MKVFRIIGHSFLDAFRSIFRNFSLSVASMSCTAITLILVAIAILFTFNINNVNKEIKNVLTIVVFVDTNASNDEIENVKKQLINIENIDEKKLEYKSKEQLKKEMIEKDEDMKALMDTLDDNVNPIESTFVVTVKDVKKITETANAIKKIDKVTSVKYGENIVKKVVSMFDVIKNACIVAVGALIVVTWFLISNTIKLTIYSRRNEISIMRLVGTSNTVIKLPFLIEGFILGLLGAIIPVLLTIYGYTYLYDYVGGKLFVDLMILVKPEIIIYETSLVLLIVGGLVGMFGSLRAVRRFLKI